MEEKELAYLLEQMLKLDLTNKIIAHNNEICVFTNGDKITIQLQKQI